MNREELRRYIMEEYHAENDFPWLRHPENEVFRHPGNRKWFALIMEVTGDRLGLPDQEKHAVVNLKCDPLPIGSLRAEPGFSLRIIWTRQAGLPPLSTAVYPTTN